MPTIAVDKEDLYKALGREYTTEEFDELCFEFGIELDEDTTEDCVAGERPELKIEVPANRYDLLCFEGISRALKVFLGKMEPPVYKAVEAKEPYEVFVEPETQEVRQFVAAGILRGVKFDKRRYDSFIALQDKLHSNLGRNRSLVSMGTHDLDKVVGKKIRYRAMKPEDMKFIPLNQEKEMNGKELMEFYEQDKNLGKFLPIVRDKPYYPVFYDEDDNVLSFPPIINSDKTKISLETTNVFLDVTGTDKTKNEIVVNQLVAMFSEYCSEPFTFEPVKIISDHNNETRMCPDMTPRAMSAEVKYINSVVGLDYSGEKLCRLLNKMCLDAKPESEQTLKVNVPATRPDVLHQCDIMEDAAIAYGFNNLEKTFPADSYTVAEALPQNKVSDIVRREAAMATWLEVMPLTLCSRDENFTYLRKKDDGESAVVLANPKTQEYQVVRTSLLPGLLKTIRENRKNALPLKVFEAGDVVFKAPETERQSVNRRRFGAVYAGKTSGFEVVHGLLDRLMQMLRVPHSTASTDKRGYWLEEISSIPTYFPGRGAEIHFREAPGKPPVVLGSLGVLHPEVLASFEIPYVASSLEIDLEVFVI